MKPIIYGTGMCARAVIDSLGQENIEIIQPTKDTRPESIDLDGIKFRVCAHSQGGLSSLYHGITPCNTINATQNTEYLKTLKLKVKPELMSNGYFVPRKVPRPTKIKNTHQGNVKLTSNNTAFLCLSVVGNLSVLQEYRHIPDNVTISDDLIIGIGSFNELPKSLQPIQYIDGVVFPIISVPSGIITFRPVYNNDLQLDFSKNILKQLGRGSVRGILPKVLQAIYLKHGLQPSFLRPVKWLATLQLNIPNFYTLRDRTLIPNSDLISDTRKKIPAYLRLIRREITTFEEEPPTFFNGIHLGYDREILRNVPDNIQVYDTSLNDRPGTHPTIKTYCKIRELLHATKT